MISRLLNKRKFNLLGGIILTIGLISMSLVGATESYAASPYSVNVTRALPSSVVPGQTFNVTITFTAPIDQFNTIGLIDYVPSGWNITANNTLSTPNIDYYNIIGNEIDYIWAGSYTNGTTFTAVYQVTVPTSATPGSYNFTNSSPGPHLEYFVGGSGAYDNDIVGQNSVTIASPLSSDATLSGLTISSGTLTPGFTSGNTSYTDSVGNGVNFVTVTPTVNQANATVTVNAIGVTSGAASGAISLAVGPNTITVKVTAQFRNAYAGIHIREHQLHR
jgi:hypothetical protein